MSQCLLTVREGLNINGAWYLAQAHMQNFVGKIVNMMKGEGLFAWQGGPIILAQVS